MGGGPGVLQRPSFAIYIAPNGRLFATLPEPIKRARDQDFRGFAGEGNVAEAERANASERSPSRS